MRVSPTIVFVVVALVCFVVPVSAQTHKVERVGHRDLPPFKMAGQASLCEVDAGRMSRRGLSGTGRGIPDGEPLSFLQDPAILRPDHAGSIRLFEFALAGDHPVVTFERDDRGAPAGIIVEQWARTGTRTVSGRTVSVFEPSWSRRVWSERLRYERYGFDRPYVLWGRVVVPSAENGGFVATRKTRPLYLRVGSTGLPVSHVRQIAPNVQYASHVVNLVMPGFGDSRVLGGTYAFDLPTAAHDFFAHFADTYDSIAFVPQRSQLGSFGAFHRNVKNEVEGIGKPLLDQAHAYGSAGRLQSVELYAQGQFATNENSSHEIAHQWGDGFDWATLGGIDRAGWHPSSHTPLLYRGATLIGAVLRGSRRVRNVEPTRFEIEPTTGSLRFHPLQMYRMGLVPAAAVPDVLVFADQNQFESQLPPSGQAVSGRTNRVTIDGIVAHHGLRRGPRPTTWRRATVIVSTEGLLSQTEMDYWNFFAQRLADPNRTAVSSYDGYPSFDALTNNLVDLQTDIMPRGDVPIVQPLPVDYPVFGQRDWPGLIFDSAVPSRYGSGTRTRLSGHVTDREHPVDSLLVRFWKHNGGSEDALRYWASVDADGSFVVELEAEAFSAGSYSMGVFLFWPGSGSQHPRALLSPVVVD